MRVFCNFLECLIFKHWNKRWVVLKNDMIFYSNEPEILNIVMIIFNNITYPLEDNP